MPRPPPKRKKRRKGFARGGARADHYAHHVVENALRSGALVRPERCEACGQKPETLANGKNAIQAHHDDYNYPMRVRWLCKPCHFRWHRRHVAIPRREDAPPIERKKTRRKAPGAAPRAPGNDLVDRLRSAVLDDAAMLARA